MRRLPFFAATLLLAAAPARSAAPVVEYLYPSGGQRGSTVSVKVGGKFDKWPVQIWTDSPAIKAQPAAESGNVSIQVDKDVPAGPHLLRFYNADGPSPPQVFVVGEHPELAEAEPNDEAAKAQAVAQLPVVLNGRLEKNGDVDSYAVKLEAGGCVTASVQGRRLGSPVDPMLHLYDSDGRQLAFAHDGLGLDPLLVFRAENAGTYCVRVSAFPYPPAADVKLTGKAEDVYRLYLSAGAPVRYAYPAAVRRGMKASVRLFGWGEAGEGKAVDVDATAAGDDADGVDVPAPGVEGALRLAVADGPEWTEAEANSASAAGSRAAPLGITGRLDRDGEEDAFPFTAKKGEKVVLTAQRAALASGMDPVLRVENAEGKTLASDDDGGGREGTSPVGGDARVEWEAGADGAYRAVVGDLFGRGGEEYVYRLALRRPNPATVAAVAGDEYKLAPGKSEAVKVKVTRAAADTGGLVLAATGLPAGVTATSADVPPGGGEVTLTLTAAADAKPAAGPFRVMLLSTDPQRPAARGAHCLLKKDTGQELVSKTEAIWLTVLPAAPEAAKK